MRYVPSIFAVIAIWLFAAPFLLGYQDTTNALRNDVTVEMVMLLTAIWWGFRELKAKAGTLVSRRTVTSIVERPKQLVAGCARWLAQPHHTRLQW